MYKHKDTKTRCDIYNKCIWFAKIKFDNIPGHKAPEEGQLVNSWNIVDRGMRRKLIKQNHILEAVTRSGLKL